MAHLNHNRNPEFPKLHKILRLLIGLFLGLCGLIFLPRAAAQENVMLRLSEPDLSAFPEVRVNVLSSDGRGAPLAENELSRLSLRENGVPIADARVQFVPVGVDIIFVLDADQSLNIIDEGRSVTRLETVQDSLARYAGRFMNPGGLDRISLLVPDAANEAGQFLVQDVSSPDSLVAAIQNYAPELAETAPINAMMAQAIAHAAAIKESGRYQAVLLLSEARRLNQFLDFADLTAQAQAVELPLFTAILGAQASLDEVNAAAALYQPTRATYVHVPRPEAADSLFLIWQRQGNQAQIRYRSLLRESGRYPITVNIGSLVAATEMVLEIAPPQVALALPTTAWQRRGSTPDTPLLELEPGTLEIPLQLTWPDGLPREITAVSLLVDGQIQPQLNLPEPDDAGLLTLAWNVQSVDTGAYRLVAEVSDVLGYTVATETIVVTITAVWPEPPTPTPLPTATPNPVKRLTEAATAIPNETWRLVIGGLVILGVLPLVVRLWRSRSGKSSPAPSHLQENPDALAAEDETIGPMIAYLQLVEDAPGNRTEIVLDGENLTIGRDHEVAQIVFADSSVARLHARIRRRNGRFWLYDEGSASGTFLNHERLGLSPRQLQDGDEIRLGRLNLRFQLRPETPQAEAAEAAEAESPEDEANLD